MTCDRRNIGLVYTPFDQRESNRDRWSEQVIWGHAKVINGRRFCQSAWQDLHISEIDQVEVGPGARCISPNLTRWRCSYSNVTEDAHTCAGLCAVKGMWESSCQSPGVVMTTKQHHSYIPSLSCITDLWLFAIRATICICKRAITFNHFCIIVEYSGILETGSGP